MQGIRSYLLLDLVYKGKAKSFPFREAVWCEIKAANVLSWTLQCVKEREEPNI